jgi:Ca2+-binding EF-hand superfamily protein
MCKLGEPLDQDERVKGVDAMKAMQLLRCASVALLAGGAWSALEGSALSGMIGDDAVKQFDLDGDGSIDLKEAKAGGAALFDILDVDHDGTLTNKELGGRAEVLRHLLPSPNPYKMFAAEGAMTRDDYLSLTETRFKLCDSDNDGKLDAKELDSEAGQALLKLLQ